LRGRRQPGISLADIQMMTPHFQALGATEVPRAEFLKRLKETQAKGLGLFDAPTAP